MLMQALAYIWLLYATVPDSPPLGWESGSETTAEADAIKGAAAEADANAASSSWSSS